MSDAYTPAFDQMELENGLRVQLRHEPRLKRAAASLRVAAGSHDVPSAWPGLAHFLEHLFFLGTARYSRDQGLMTFVQRHGGQLNASTRERTTDFFFELPVESFPGALERLCEMLAHPRLDVSDQLREREVLHAEFIAWSRDPQARHQQWLTSALAASHPLRAFHAGNRYSLPVPREAFQQDLQAFYRRYYHAGQMTLCLAGPQPLEQLQALARKSGSLLPSGTLTPRLPHNHCAMALRRPRPARTTSVSTWSSPVRACPNRRRKPWTSWPPGSLPRNLAACSRNCAAAGWWKT